MGFTLENAQQWIGVIRNGGQLPKVDYALLNASIANAGNITRDVDLSKQTPEQLESLALESVDSAPFADKAQSKEMLKAYIKSDLIPNSYKIDEEKGLEKGTSLRKFFDDTRKATKGVDFEKFKESPMAYMMKQDKKEVERITTEIRGSAHENIKHEILNKEGTSGGRTIEQDFVHSIKTKTDEKGESIYKDCKADEPKALGGGMMEMIIAFIGMLLGVDLGGLFGGRSPSNQSYEERASNPAPASPGQQETIDKIEKASKFASILKDNAIDKGEFGSILSGEEKQQPMAAVNMDDHVILTPNAKGDNPGDTVIYAKKDAEGRLSEIQVSAKGTVKTVEGDFILTDDNAREVGGAIAETAEKSGKVVDGQTPNVLADDVASGLSAAMQKLREQGAGR